MLPAFPSPGVRSGAACNRALLEEGEHMVPESVYKNICSRESSEWLWQAAGLSNSVQTSQPACVEGPQPPAVSPSLLHMPPEALTRSTPTGLVCRALVLAGGWLLV